jgi:tRNA A-37 threonylcarbamoyl transferase component Bud32
VKPARGSTPSLAELQLTAHQLGGVTAGLDARSHVVLGEFDRDSLLQSLIGPISGVADVTDDFQKRRHTRVQLVATSAGVGVRKYHPNRWRFLCELRALHVLQTTDCRVPAILDADFDTLAITSAYIPGTVLTEKLALRSQGIRDRDVETHARNEGMHGRKLWNARIQEGNRVLYEAVTPAFGRQVRHALEKVHAARVIWGDVKFGNIVVERSTGRPWLLDFDYAAHLPRLWDPLFGALRRHELACYDLHFGRGTCGASSYTSDGSPLTAVERLLSSGDPP